MATLVRETSSLNNDAVRLFEEELYPEAIDFFQLCLDQISEYQIDQECNIQDTSESCEDVKRQEQLQNTATPATTMPPPNPFHGWSKPAERPSTEAGSPFLFARVIRIRELQQLQPEESSPSSAVTRILPSTDDDHLSDTLLRAYKAALHYNLAVAHQLILLRKRAEPIISSAALVYRHYEAAYIEWKTAKSENSPHDMNLLGLALFNNMGVVFCSEMARFREAFECFKAACGVMCGLDDEVLEGDEIYEISMNAFLVPSEACPAA